METKKCPFCFEEIRIEAIKCKHCGEFLNESDKKSSQEKSNSENNNHVAIPSKLLHQNFSLPIILCYLGILLSFFAIRVSLKNPEYSESTTSSVVDLINSFFLVGILIFLRKYLINFNIEKIRKNVKVLIIIESILIPIITLVLVFEKIEELYSIFAFIGFVVIIVSIIYTIIVGTQLTKLKNEYFKQLRRLGYSLIIITISLFICQIVQMASKENEAISNFSSVVCEILGFVQILFFLDVFRDAKNKLKEEIELKKEVLN